jgi:hypothetical protein
MTRWIIAALAVLLASSPTRSPADEGADAILDKAIEALGGKERLDKAEALSISYNGTHLHRAEETDASWKLTFRGTDHMRHERKIGDFHDLFVVAGNKGWLGNGTEFETDPEMKTDTPLDQERRLLHLYLVPIRPVVLRGRGYNYESAGEAMVGGRPASALKVTDHQGEVFTIDFDNESGLPVRLRARIYAQGREYDQEMRYSDYKDFGGIKKATKVETRHNGVTISQQELTEFKVLDKVDPDTFAQPK